MAHQIIHFLRQHQSQGSRVTKPLQRCSDISEGVRVVIVDENHAVDRWSSNSSHEQDSHHDLLHRPDAARQRLPGVLVAPRVR